MSLPKEAMNTSHSKEELEQLAQQSKRFHNWFKLFKKSSYFPLISLLSFESSLILISRHIIPFSPELLIGIILIFLLADIICILVLFKVFQQRRHLFFNFMSTVPWVKKGFHEKSLSEFAYSMEKMLQEKVPLSDAFKRSGKASFNKEIEEAGQGLAKDAEEGKSIGYYFHAYLCFTDDFGELYRATEQEQELEESFNYLGRKYDDQADESLTANAFIYGILFSTACFICLIIESLLSYN